MRRPRLFTLIAVALAVNPAAAITVEPMAFRELVDRSALVAYARVRDVRGQRTGAGDGVESVVTADVIAAYKGAPGATLSFATPGGRLGRYVQVLPGAPSFAPGDLVVVFLMSRGPRLPVTTGFSQGVYRVMADPGSGAAVVTPPVVEPAAAGRIVRGDVGRRPLPLEAFAAAVREAAAR